MNKKIYFATFIIFWFILILWFITLREVPIKFLSGHSDTKSKVDKGQIFNFSEGIYLVNGSKCKIYDIDAFDTQVLKYFRRLRYIPCRKHKLLTYLKIKNNTATLKVDVNAIRYYSQVGLKCCYSYIKRGQNETDPDDAIDLTECYDFDGTATMTEDSVLIQCENLETKAKVYENTHTAMLIKPEVMKKIEKFEDNRNPFNVLIIGIDSLSRLNFRRNLPRSHSFLEQYGWISLKGYNKIADNTFPNLMGILTGFNESDSYAICKPTIVGGLDKCPMIWYDFRKLGYVTAYAEDETWMSTFNFHKKGFTNPPTDYYFRHYLAQSELLCTEKKFQMTYCAGPVSSGERIFDIAKDFVKTFKRYPNFGLFWMNTFSHNNLNVASGMDKVIRTFLQNITDERILTKSIIIFLSDHGIRFGDFRSTPMGWLEERLPFIYIWIPHSFRQKFPKEFTNLKINSHKLTNPYDIYMTLQHILVLSGHKYKIKPSKACPNCKSLFMKIESERSCEDAGIDQHWCTCADYKYYNNNPFILSNASTFIIAQIHKIIHISRGDYKCERYTLSKVVSVFDSVLSKNQSYILMVIETKPKAFFEATLLYRSHLKQKFKLEGGISRVDLYGPHSDCVSDDRLKKFCYCKI